MSTDGHQQWRTHYSSKIGGGWLARLFGKPSAPKPQKPGPELKHPRRLRASGFMQQPDGSHVHYTGYRIATPEQSEWCRIHDPERGLHEKDLAAYRSAQRGPVARFLVGLMFRRN
jgi:hypothetical protein